MQADSIFWVKIEWLDGKRRGFCLSYGNFLFKGSSTLSENLHPNWLCNGRISSSLQSATAAWLRQCGYLRKSNTTPTHTSPSRNDAQRYRATDTLLMQTSAFPPSTVVAFSIGRLDQFPYWSQCWALIAIVWHNSTSNHYWDENDDEQKYVL